MVNDNQDWITCYLGLGSNLANELGSPVEHIQQALNSLDQHQEICTVRASSFYSSSPMGPQDQPDFVNIVAELKTRLSALALLALCQSLEQQAGRARKRHWGERSLDVDVLLYGQQQITEPSLIVPHAGLTDRNFVLVPLRELVPEITITNHSIKSYEHSTDWTGLKKMNLAQWTT